MPPTKSHCITAGVNTYAVKCSRETRAYETRLTYSWPNSIDENTWNGCQDVQEKDPHGTDPGDIRLGLFL